MKRLIALLFAVSATLAATAKPIAIHLDPDAETPQIGSLEAISLAVPAEWPQGVEPVSGWQPIYYRGVFQVYLDNNDISKDLSPKPGSLYYLSPDKNSPSLAIATEKDKADILSVNTWFCKLQLETIVLGYIQNTSIDAGSIVTSLPDSSQSTGDATEAAVQQTPTEMAGRLVKTGLIGKKRTGASYKLTTDNGKTLAFIDATKVPDRVRIDELLSQPVRVSGFLGQVEDGSDVIILANSIKRSN
ncbi:hypothetical protein [Pelagicoccus albus]|uniref:Uncharacterized protein n=1 Tax=Pelagicoccus albus TaxID=415222 RepID=A0A7X1B2L4_9BACT|nr:hypothetical protein [Pelagicoccus albus]MBC2604495.1 hypothetical protein [Pelagicoccus albus]